MGLALGWSTSSPPPCITLTRRCCDTSVTGWERMNVAALQPCWDFFFFYRECCCLPPAGWRSLLLLQDDVLSEGGRSFSLNGERTFSRVCDQLRVRRFAFQKRNITHLKRFPLQLLVWETSSFFFLFLLFSERRTLCEGKTHTVLKCSSRALRCHKPWFLAMQWLPGGAVIKENRNTAFD